jgi:hypothetical protein
MGRAKGATGEADKGKKAAVESPEEILAAAKKSSYDMLAFARGARRSAAAIRGERFEWNRRKSTIDGATIHYFRTPGETLVGILGPAEFESWKGVSYKLILDDGSYVRLPGNRQLNRLIHDAQCVHLRIKIEYLGKRWLTSRHYEKVYAIHPAPLSAESILDTKAGREVMAKLGQISSSSRKAKPAAAKRTPEETKEARRTFLRNMVKSGHKIKPETLKEFKGEDWADKAIKEAGK